MNTPKGQVPEALTGDKLREIARSARTSASDSASPGEYVLAGWRAAQVAALTAAPAEANTASGAADLRNALVTAEAALADIGDADREPGDDLAWCEARAAEALPEVRAALASAPAQAAATPSGKTYEVLIHDLEVIASTTLHTPLVEGRKSYERDAVRQAIGVIRASHGQAPAGARSADELARDLKNAIDTSTELRQQLRLMEDHARGEVWRWQADGADDLATMGNRMGVLIYASDLRNLIATPSPQAAQQAPAGATSPWSRALEIRIAQGWKLKGDRLPVLYTDTINGDGVGRDDLWLCTTSALAVLAAPSTPASDGWINVKDQLPPCRDDQDYIGINSAGFAGIFNAVADIAGNVYCMMETAEDSVSIMSDLSIWKPFIRPLPASPTIEGASNGS